MARLQAVVLAAGRGTRMHSSQPKVLHQVAGKPMLAYILAAVEKAGLSDIAVVVGHRADLVARSLGERYTYIHQEPQRGTGDAVRLALEAMPAEVDDILVLPGDTPLVTAATLQGLVARHHEAGGAATLVLARPESPGGYGRVRRGADGRILGIVEEKDAGPDELAIREVNAGMYCFRRAPLAEALAHLSPANAQGEYYLTDVIALLAARGLPVVAVEAGAEEVLGVNSRSDLARAEKIVRRQINQALMAAGVTMVDPENTYVDAGVSVGADTIIYPLCFLEGATRVGRESRIGPGVTLRDSVVGDNVTIMHAVVLSSRVGDGSQVGPFAYLRPGTVLAAGAKVGDFVELKSTFVGPGSKVPHLSYLGDAQIGAGVNVGAGTITCNYDGQDKWPTIIEDEAFIGSNANLVAPVRVGRGAVVGAGSTITRDVPAEALGLGRERQVNIGGWKERQEKKKQQQKNSGGG
ncbi:MAG: bifunctional UDP-N-acetylglucosamine diphosphorylase/glucosamine-1-phosphate N-acetyltransferase GlmU [Clostridia bacterium]|nr:MAG: bifunctional UDP-N-acetylglucosamine diphosphorylase/glucosamine-1-phosphate N-acetyltransferase GlmU [Clostridia bacterium]